MMSRERIHECIVEQTVAESKPQDREDERSVGETEFVLGLLEKVESTCEAVKRAESDRLENWIGEQTLEVELAAEEAEKQPDEGEADKANEDDHEKFYKQFGST